MDFALTGPEMVFLIVAILATIPILVFLRFIIRELGKEEKTGEPGPDQLRPGPP